MNSTAVSKIRTQCMTYNVCVHGSVMAFSPGIIDCCEKATYCTSRAILPFLNDPHLRLPCKTMPAHTRTHCTAVSPKRAATALSYIACFSFNLFWCRCRLLYVVDILSFSFLPFSFSICLCPTHLPRGIVSVSCYPCIPPPLPLSPCLPSARL